MEIIKPTVEFLGEVPLNPSKALRLIEAAGRTCYKSEDRITDGSAIGFCQRTAKNKHWSVLEHSNFVVRSSNSVDSNFLHESILNLFGERSRFHRIRLVDGRLYLAGSIRAWHETFNEIPVNAAIRSLAVLFYEAYKEILASKITLQNTLRHFQVVTDSHEVPKILKRLTFRFITDRGVTHELVRHRLCAFSQESTRYVNYKGMTMQFIEPPWDWGKGDTGIESEIKAFLLETEIFYNRLIDRGFKPQQARYILPNGLKTEIVVTADVDEWWHIINLRSRGTSGVPHPQIKEIINPVQLQLEQMGLDDPPSLIRN